MWHWGSEENFTYGMVNYAFMFKNGFGLTYRKNAQVLDPLVQILITTPQTPLILIQRNTLPNMDLLGTWPVLPINQLRR
jgi:hypothetical protein